MKGKRRNANMTRFNLLSVIKRCPCLKLFERKDKLILFNVINNIRRDKPSGYMDFYSLFYAIHSLQNCYKEQCRHLRKLFPKVERLKVFDVERVSNTFLLLYW